MADLSTSDSHPTAPSSMPPSSAPLDDPKKIKKEAVKPQEKKPEEKPPPRPLTPLEKSVLEARRKIFRKLHDFFLEADIYEAEGKLGVIVGTLNVELEKLAKKYHIWEIDFEKPDQDFKDVMEILKDCTLEEATTYAAALQRAIEHERYQQTKAWKLKDLKITLL